MSPRFARRARWLAVVTALALAGGCTPERQPFALCDRFLGSVEVFNVYADHPHADLHVVADEEALDLACDVWWGPTVLEVRSFDEADLTERATTVFVVQRDDGTTRTVWAHRLAGLQAGTAILTDDGGSFWSANRSLLPQYYGPDAGVVDRDRVPLRDAAG